MKVDDFQNEDALIYLNGLKDNSVNLVLTDPPYAISRKTNFAAGDKTGKDVDRFRVSYEFGEWDAVDLDYFKEVFTQTKRVMKNGASLIVFYDLWKIQELREVLENLGFRMFRVIEWVKTNPVPLNSSKFYLTNARETAIVCVKGSNPTFNSVYNKGTFEYPIYHGKDRFHTTQKNLKLFEELISIHTNEEDVVLDFFAGSATTQVAAKNTNRFYLGCEKNQDYFLKAKERLNK